MFVHCNNCKRIVDSVDEVFPLRAVEHAVPGKIKERCPGSGETQPHTNNEPGDELAFDELALVPNPEHDGGNETISDLVERKFRGLHDELRGEIEGVLDGLHEKLLADFNASLERLAHQVNSIADELAAARVRIIELEHKLGAPAT